MNPAERKARVWAIVPAAGAGRRMGGPKQVLPFRGSTLTGRVVHTLLEADVDVVVVVTRAALVDALKLPDDPRVAIALNDTESEMIDSIRIGLVKLAEKAKPGSITAAGIMVVPGDMPALSTSTCRRCIDVFRDDPCRIVIAVHSGRRGHPIIFPNSMREAVDGLEGGLNELPRMYRERVRQVDVADPGVARDVDTVADYDSLRDRPHATDGE
jgi:molybdenum cofactor cytidylyltransferase